ncbi:MAG: AAA family ATPase [Candidatus Nanoarchaeia archaeon]|nr:AAA family ATPase [Candidatus Nanoarchaeia archaeon]MDD5588348.1 AAA family ATPase [Candidatus Nanoarchaeia archaeon]
MIIKKLKLENIRSYTDQEINFPEGSVLLSGNVGSGKSSILLAIDFALFGLQKGNITGDSLLRNDADKGTVELHFDLDERPIFIKRNLRREGSKVVQDSGFIEVNGSRKAGTATELKQQVLQLLNYPSELLTKSKGLIYRYTVYTPQEEMKYILMANKDERLDVLRRIFGIDKYKRVKDNSKIFTTYLKDKKKEFSGIFLDLDSKIKEKVDKEKSQNKIKEDLLKLDEELKISSKNLEEKKGKIKQHENQIKEFTNLKQELSINNVNERNLKEKQILFLRDIKELESFVSEFKEEKLDLTIREQIIKKEKEFGSVDKDIKNVLLELNKIDLKVSDSESLKKKIHDLSKCPTCLQDVSEIHKEKILKRENENLEKYKEHINIYSKRKEEYELLAINLKKEIEDLRKKDNEQNVYKIKLENFKEKQTKLLTFKKEIEKIEQEIRDLVKKSVDINLKLKNFANLEKDYELLRRDYETSQLLQKNIEIKKASIQKELENSSQLITNLEKDIENKLFAKENYTRFENIQNWFEQDFVNLVENIEKQVMFKIHHDFDGFFQKWFDILINNELLKIKLDNDFSPLIEQNGHDIDYEYISGGERTAAALAYRLSLNQVINNLITNIKTKDIIILDEPTDGFSSEQLDRIRILLDELNVKQTIIVSHDPKIESFVENIIKLNKKNHISSIE